MYGIGLDLQQQGLVLVTALLASVGAAGIPMAGLVMLVVVLEAVGLPLQGIATIIAVDRVLDMLRTSTNVWSDLVCAAVVSRFEEPDAEASSS
jgi:Na+/H+-dicarboxylate symporter